MLISRVLNLAISGRHGGRCFQASRVLDPELRRQLPSPVPRDEFTLLKCLAGASKAEADAVPHYAIDDSLFLRYRLSSVALARRSGRNVARSFLETNAIDLAEFNKEKPAVPAWRPMRSIENLDNSEQNLNLLIGLQRVDLSWRMYNKLLSDGAGVSDDTKQSLLELQAYYAGLDPPLRDISPEEIYFSDRLLIDHTDAVNAWSAADNPAKSIYRSLAEPSLAAKVVMLKAHCRHQAYAECVDLYSQLAGKPGLDSQCHSAGLLAIAAHRRSWPPVLAAFRRVAKPDLAAYQALLRALPLVDDLPDGAGGRVRIVCSLLAELRQSGLESRCSLATATLALRAAYAAQLKPMLSRFESPSDWQSNPGLPEAERAGLLPPLLASLCANPPDPLEASQPEDLAFFPTAAFLACRVYASRELSDQLDRLLHSGAFLTTLGSQQEHRIVYEYHLLNLLTDPSADVNSIVRYYSDRIQPSGVGLLSHLNRVMRKCVARQAVDRLPSLMVRCLAFVDLMHQAVLAPGYSFFRCAEIIDQMFADSHPAVRDAEFLADLRLCLAGFSDAINNEFVYEKKKRGQDQKQSKRELHAVLDADNAATLIRLAVKLPDDADRELAMRLSGQLAECLANRRVSSLNYVLALLELAAKMRLTPSYEQRAACQSVSELLDRAAREFQTKRIDKSDVARLARLSELAESSSAFLTACDYRLSETQATAHSQLARAAAEMRDRGASGNWALDSDATDVDSDAAWEAAAGLETDADAETDLRVEGEADADSDSESDRDNKGGGRRR